MSKEKEQVVATGSGEGFKVKIFDLDKGLTVYDHVKIVRLVCKAYNLLIMEDYWPIIGEINGSIDIKGDNVDLHYDNIEAFYMNSNNVFNLMLKEVE